MRERVYCGKCKNEWHINPYYPKCKILVRIAEEDTFQKHSRTPIYLECKEANKKNNCSHYEKRKFLGII